MLRPSRYNVYFDDGNKHYLFNTWKSNLSSLDERTLDALKTNSLDELTESETLLLLNKGILTQVENEFNAVVEENKASLEGKEFATCIAPTLSCNAQCEYCFERGISSAEPDESAVDNIVKYIAKHCHGRKVHILWFGGEPLLSVDKMCLIADKLRDLKVEFYSTMMTNGYLLGENIRLMKDVCHLEQVQITLDGPAETFNAVKKIAPDAFDKVMENIQLSVQQKLKVAIRINFDAQTPFNYKEIIRFLHEKFGNSVKVYFHDIVGANYLTPNEVNPNPFVEIYNELINYNYVRSPRDMLVKRTYRQCNLNTDDYVVICPDGSLTKCTHHIGKKDEFDVGNIADSAVNAAKQFPVLHDECSNCVCFPICGGGCYSDHLRRHNAGCLRIKSALTDVLKLFVKRLLTKRCCTASKSNLK